MLPYYRFATHLAAPLVPLWLRLRARRGKEERGRMAERFGITSYGRPQGKLLWIHAASVGEANSVLSLIERLKTKFPALSILLTTGTVTSAQLMKQRLPAGVIHQYAPVDTPEASARFIRHWLPDVAWFVESELWPNLIAEAQEFHCLMALINARMSERSFNSWKKHPKAAKDILGPFRLCFAQSEADAARLKALGASEVLSVGNLKFDAPPLPCDEAELLRMRNEFAGRTLWLAASTHPGEEPMVARAHAELAKTIPGLLTVIVPRHPERGAQVAAEIAKYGKTALRSQKQKTEKDVAFYVADTLGELGLFYRLSEVAFMGGSLVKHGGQNPLEPAQLSCAIISGQHTHNFTELYAELKSKQAAVTVKDEKALAGAVLRMLTDSNLRSAMQARAKECAGEKTGAGNIIIDIFSPLFAL